MDSKDENNLICEIKPWPSYYLTSGVDEVDRHKTAIAMHNRAAKATILARLITALNSRVVIADYDADSPVPDGLSYSFKAPGDPFDSDIDQSDEFTRHADAIAKVACAVHPPMHISHMYLYRPGSKYSVTVSLE